MYVENRKGMNLELWRRSMWEVDLELYVMVAVIVKVVEGHRPNVWLGAHEHTAQRALIVVSRCRGRGDKGT